MTHEDIGRCSLPSPRVDFNDRSWNRSTMCVIIFNALTTGGGNSGKVIEVLLGHIRRRRRRRHRRRCHYRLGKTIHSCAEFLENSGQRYYRPLGTESEYFVYRNPIISISTHIATEIILCGQQFELIESIEQIFNLNSRCLRRVRVIATILKITRCLYVAATVLRFILSVHHYTNR